MGPMAVMVNELLDMMKSRGLRRCGANVVTELRFKDAKGKEEYTRTWYEFHSIYNLLCAEAVVNPQHYCEIMQHVVDDRFPEFKRDRFMYSFLNGRTEVGATDGVLATCVHAQTPADANDRCAYHMISANLPSLHAKTGGDDWFDIPTPHIQSLLSAQRIPADAARWIYALIGRTFFPVDTFEQWQVSLLLIGASGTGKSNLSVLLQSFHPPGSVAINHVSEKNQNQRNVSLLIQSDAKHLQTATVHDIDRVYRGRGGFHVINTCDNDQISNVPPDLKRCLVVVNFPHHLPMPFPSTEADLNDERGSLFIKATRAYVHMARTCPNLDHLPTYFKTTSDRAFPLD